MTYIATIAIDFTKQQPNAYSRLVNALIQAGWDKVETSLFMIGDDDLLPVMLGIEVVVRQARLCGDLSTLSITVAQRLTPQTPASAPHHTQALRRVLAEPLPSDDV